LFSDQHGIVNKVAIVNEKAARHYWPHENPIGRRITTGLRDLLDCEVVGIVKDVKTESLRAEAQPTVYVPFALNSMGHVTLHVRVAGDPGPVISALRQEVHSLDPNLPLRDITTMAAQIDRTIALDRLLALLTTLFGFLAVALATVGLYGVIAFAVAARTREIGIRMALGADRARVLFQIVRESLLLTALGIALGVPAALWASRAIGSQLYGLRTTDPATYIVLSLALTAVALSAAWIPARRAAHVDPMVALRYE
jgi:predicted permease